MEDKMEECFMLTSTFGNAMYFVHIKIRQMMKSSEIEEKIAEK